MPSSCFVYSPLYDRGSLPVSGGHPDPTQKPNTNLTSHRLQFTSRWKLTSGTPSTPRNNVTSVYFNSVLHSLQCIWATFHLHGCLSGGTLLVDILGGKRAQWQVDGNFHLEGGTPLKSLYADVHLSTGRRWKPVLGPFYKLKNPFPLYFCIWVPHAGWYCQLVSKWKTQR